MLHENEAAEVLRRVCQGRFLKASKPKEGKIELTAETDGLLKVDKEKLNAVNGLGQIVIASRPREFSCEKRRQGRRNACRTSRDRRRKDGTG